MVNIRFSNRDDWAFLLKNTRLTEHQISVKTDSQELIIAQNNSENVGLLILDLLWNHIPFIANIWVAENNRGKGIGKALLKFLENHLIKLNAKVVFSSSMETALKAQEWHNKMGFSKTGTIHNINDNNVGEVFFRKELN